MFILFSMVPIRAVKNNKAQCVWVSFFLGGGAYVAMGQAATEWVRTISFSVRPAHP